VFTSILCPVDCSAHSERALGYAVDLAHLTGGSLTLVNVVDALLDAAAHASGSREAFTTQNRQEVEALLARVVAGRPGRAVRTEVHIAVGNAPDEILKQVDACAADVVVMGTQGLNAAERFVFGSTTERVLRHSHVPVLAVPKGDR
jgi:nucleotide-binding universal stress UspA family protein